MTDAVSTTELLEARVAGNDPAGIEASGQSVIEQVRKNLVEAATPTLSSLGTNWMLASVSEQAKAVQRSMARELSRSTTQQLTEAINKPLYPTKLLQEPIAEAAKSPGQRMIEELAVTHRSMGEQLRANLVEQLTPLSANDIGGRQMQPLSGSPLGSLDTSSADPPQPSPATSPPVGERHCVANEVYWPVEEYHRLLDDLLELFPIDQEEWSKQDEPLRTRSQLWFGSGMVIMKFALSIEEPMLQQTVFATGFALVTESFKIEFMGADPIRKMRQHSDHTQTEDDSAD